jgi:hypothetical protein
MTNEEKIVKQLMGQNISVGQYLLLAAFMSLAPREKFLKAAEQAYDFAAIVRGSEPE